MKKSRRNFIKKVTMGSAALSFSAKSYANIMGANDRINLAITGVNGRGMALLKSTLANQNTVIRYICDVDSRAMSNAINEVNKLTGTAPQGIKDYRRLLEKTDLDVVAIASPDNWHAPMGIMAMKAGRHVYLEKPAAQNAAEVKKLIEVQMETGRLLQIGTQQRSAPTSQLAIQEIRSGIIGIPYFAKAWYSNKRTGIGSGKVVEIPDWLDWDLWQGPAPRKMYKDNFVHYNWHWLKHWGTGEVHNNGTHEIDIARWALGVDLPKKVSSSGGRFHFKDDWEFYDTQVVNYEYEDSKLITWEGKSCNNFTTNERDRGTLIHGTEGSVLLDRNGYIRYDLSGKKVFDIAEKSPSATTDLVGAGALDVFHMKNLLDAIRIDTPLNAPICNASNTNLMCHYANMAQDLNRPLEINTETGVVHDKEAMKSWQRDYEPGWDF